jgi:hypothetical protein
VGYGSLSVTSFRFLALACHTYILHTTSETNPLKRIIHIVQYFGNETDHHEPINVATAGAYIYITHAVSSKG